jgi:hypothetical protein
MKLLTKTGCLRITGFRKRFPDCTKCKVETLCLLVYFSELQTNVSFTEVFSKLQKKYPLFPFIEIIRTSGFKIKEKRKYIKNITFADIHTRLEPPSYWISDQNNECREEEKIGTYVCYSPFLEDI